MNSEALRPRLGRLATSVLIVVAIAGVFQFFAPSYLSERNLLAMLTTMSSTASSPIRPHIRYRPASLDLSLAGSASLSAMTLGFFLAETASLYPSVLGFSDGHAMQCDLVGILIGKFRLPDVVTTIAIGSIAYGIAFVYNGGANYSSNFFSTGILDINDGRLLFIPFPVVVLSVTAIAAYVVMHMSRYEPALLCRGRECRISAIVRNSVKLSLGAGFAICGALVGMAMVLNVAAVGAAYVNTGNRILLPSYTAVYLGAAIFGTPTVPATIAGALLMAMLLNGFTILTVPYYYSDAIVSLVLITAIAIFSPQTLIWLHNALRLFGTRPKLAAGE